MFHYVDDVEGTHTPANEFTNGDPVLGIPRTIMRAKWPNMIQRELLNLVNGAGLAPDEEQFDQVLKAVQTLMRGQRVGRIDAGPYSTIPAEALPLEGGLYSRATHAEAWAYIQAHYRVVSETTWQNGNHGAFSSGDGATTFRVPRIDDEFIRGAAGRNVGSYQGDAIRNITASFRLRNTQFNAGNHSLVVSSDGAADTESGPNATRIDGGGNNTSQPTTKVTLDASRQVPTANEVRGKNIAWRWIIWVA
jgi:microcystin-dependent protein